MLEIFQELEQTPLSLQNPELLPEIREPKNPPHKNDLTFFVPGFDEITFFEGLTDFVRLSYFEKIKARDLETIRIYSAILDNIAASLWRFEYDFEQYPFNTIDV